ncbi:MAG TPA: hypothetical protein VHY08_11590, partial [Bacillota bacterium]|nr:hypothetical protein [Bacillota bacterium]
AVIAIGYIFIEYSFMKLGIYEQHWWNFYLTAIVVFLYQVVSKIWFIKMNRIRHGLPRYLTFFLVAFVLIHLPFPLLSIYEKQHYLVGLFKNIYRSSAVFTLLYQLVESYLLVLFVCILKKWYWKLAPFIIAIMLESILAITHISVFRHGWNLCYTMVLHITSIAAFLLLEKYSLKERFKKI